jgi:hypothetical protein
MTNPVYRTLTHQPTRSYAPLESPASIAHTICVTFDMPLR